MVRFDAPPVEESLELGPQTGLGVKVEFLSASVPNVLPGKLPLGVRVGQMRRAANEPRVKHR